MNFPDWYKAQGYHVYDERERGTGIAQCANELGITKRYVRLLRDGDKKVIAGSTLEKLMQRMMPKDSEWLP